MSRRHHVDRCGYCGKLCYRNRKAAQAVAKIIPGSHMTAYRCNASHAGYDIWHLGHMPRSVVRGLSDKARFVQRCEQRDGRAS